LYARPGGRALADVFTCIREKTDLDRAGRRLLVNAERGLRDAVAMTAAFRDVPEAVTASGELALRLGFTLKDLGYRFPDFPLPPGENAQAHLRDLVARGVRARYGPAGSLAERARHQVSHELEIIGRLDLAGYFLIVWDIVEFCRANDVLVQGRGSAANSAVCYALGITAVDAVKNDLLFERFLSPERDGPPDIDLDIESGRREEAIQHVYTRYGRDRTAQVANVITYRAKSAVRDMAKALGFAPGQQDAWSKQVDAWGRVEVTIAQPDHDIPAPVLALAEQVEDFPRHLGIHSGGMVI